MSWAILALLVALFESLKDVFGKFALRHRSEVSASLVMRGGAALLLLPMVLLHARPALGPQFWPALIAGSVLNLMANVLYFRAIRLSPLSITVPIVNATPVFLLIISPLILREVPSLGGLGGVFLIVAGAYLLHVPADRAGGALAPLKSMAREPGPRLMLLTAFLWSLSGLVDKIGVKNCSPLFWTVAVSGGIAIGLIPFVRWSRIGQLTKSPNGVKWLVPLAVCSAIGLLFQMQAISQAPVYKVIAIKRTSTLLAVVWGVLIFRESRASHRFVAAALMLAGAVWVMVGM